MRCVIVRDYGRKLRRSTLPDLRMGTTLTPLPVTHLAPFVIRLLLLVCPVMSLVRGLLILATQTFPRPSCAKDSVNFI
jgi:hypothetical protein